VKRQYIKSAGIISIGYDDKNHVLEVEFVGKKVYRYYDVPHEEYENLMKSESRGEYFNKCIKPKEYKFETVE
jgi:hypothetical protein